MSDNNFRLKPFKESSIFDKLKKKTDDFLNEDKDVGDVVDLLNKMNNNLIILNDINQLTSSTRQFPFEKSIIFNSNIPLFETISIVPELREDYNLYLTDIHISNTYGYYNLFINDEIIDAQRQLIPLDNSKGIYYKQNMGFNYFDQIRLNNYFINDNYEINFIVHPSSDYFSLDPYLFIKISGKYIRKLKI